MFSETSLKYFFLYKFLVCINKPFYSLILLYYKCMYVFVWFVYFLECIQTNSVLIILFMLLIFFIYAFIYAYLCSNYSVWSYFISGDYTGTGTFFIKKYIYIILIFSLNWALILRFTLNMALNKKSIAKLDTVGLS